MILQNPWKQKTCRGLQDPLSLGTAHAYSPSDLLQARLALYHVRYRESNN
jgi:hypothetical protein